MGMLSYNLEDKVVVVTGGTRGIGLEMASVLLGQNAKEVGEKAQITSSAWRQRNPNSMEMTTFSAFRPISQKKKTLKIYSIRPSINSENLMP